ncbi:interleukin-15 isoform X4 [Parus major]|uniref:interleukin-15 isoform X4 n=1 Tax=Parus major TaxID=9157 RepID=UPI0007710976|nr:interleukin-15 isoform X4 [Parus major]XP_015480992.1 interleukin-15 isoform X4 [Parus major]XP_033369579.1 interleukin-15 isoform X4 [Parus major]
MANTKLCWSIEQAAESENTPGKCLSAVSAVSASEQPLFLPFKEWDGTNHLLPVVTTKSMPIRHAYVPKTEAGHCKWAEVLKDLERIKTSKDIDVSLYTANADEDEECQELVMRCFFLETEVIIQECRIKNCSKTQDVWNIWKNGNETFQKNKLTSTKSEKCKECEEYEEKNFTEFVQNFVKVIQRDCKH